jgi:lactate 2-monooxygenase
VSVELFGTKYRSPILVAPVGVQSIMHKDAEEATARACAKVGVPMILSTAATRTIEQVAAANRAVTTVYGHPDSGDKSAQKEVEGDRWFQLYWPKPDCDDITASLLRRAKENGYKVLVVTLDTFTLAWRPTDLDTSYLPFIWGDGCQIGLSDPVFKERYAKMLAADKRTWQEKAWEVWGIITRSGSIFGAIKVILNGSLLQKSRAWLDVMNSGTYREWKDLEIIKKLWDGPIVLKGIQTVEDARKAAEYNMDGIIVSNHGGRQLDGAIASLDALEEIAADEEVKQSGITILFDSGIRTGSDALKAIALGAKAVLVGRPYMYGLAIGGEQGVEHVLRCMMADTDNQLANLGKTSLKELGRDDLQFVQK